MAAKLLESNTFSIAASSSLAWGSDAAAAMATKSTLQAAQG
jgi:hypothetical protein